MSAQVSFWKRVGDLFRGGAGHSEHGDGNGDLRILGTTQDTNGAARADDPLDVPRSASSLLHRTRREPTVTQMRDGYQRVVGLMDAMQEHFRRQDERAEQLTHSVDRVAGILEQLADAQRSAGDCVRSIAAQTETVGRQATVLTETLAKMPASFHAQAEAFRSVARQLEISQEADIQLTHSLQRFGQAADSLRASGAAQVETLQQLHANERAQCDALTVLVSEQSRRFLIVIIVAAILGLGALIALGGTLALVLRQ